MKILAALTYYRPHVSGLTIYAERLARALAARGHAVTVLTSRFSRDLPREDTVDGVRVVRVPVAFRVSKGVIMPSFGVHATRLVREHDVLSVHLPQFDAWGLALRGRFFGKPCVLTYHCDLRLPAGLLNRVIDRATAAANWLAAHWADRIVAYTDDYAAHSPLLQRFMEKVEVILPPVAMFSPRDAEVQAFRARHRLDGRRVVGMAARFAAEKGVEVLVSALPALVTRFENLTVLFAGPYRHIVGEGAYRARLLPRIDALGDRWRFIGALAPDEMPAFYGSLDCLIVPSLNSTESFGLVQVEAMLCGTPVVASDLPGVRQAVLMTGMGEIAPVGDAQALAASITRVLERRAQYVRPRTEIAAMFDMRQTVERYERLFARELSRHRSRGWH